MSTLMFWNKQNNNNANGQNAEAKNGKRNWLHSPEALLNGHVVYLVKFLGNTPVEQAKGIDVVKDAIRRLQFAQQMKKAETGNQPKTKKVEITVSVDGVAVQEPRTQKILHQFPLHNISYCADEKGVKKFFSFIAKNPPASAAVTNGGGLTNGHHANESAEETHECFVFVSSKLASDITLTIGQAFDLAYRRYMNETGKTTESKVQTQNKQLEKTVSVYRQRLKELADVVPKADLERLLSRLGIRDILEVPAENGVVENGKAAENENGDKLLIETANSTQFVPAVPPRNNLHSQINNTIDAFKPSGQKMDELLLNSDSDSDFDPRAEENDGGNKISNDLFGFEPKTFGQNSSFGLITNNNNNNNHSFGNNNISTNGFNGVAVSAPPPTSPPPLLAPPPKAAIPRRSTPANGNNSGAEDLFGSTPFSLNSNNIFNGGSEDAPRKNPFNESGFHDMNDSAGKLFVALPEINALATNQNKLDGLLHNPLMEASPGEVGKNQKSPFTLSNPFAKRETTKALNYGHLRSSPDPEVGKHEEPISQSSQSAATNDTDKLMNAANGSGYDIFKEAAAAAFSEFNFVKSAANSSAPAPASVSNGSTATFSSSNSSSKHANEFSNQLAGFTFNTQTNESLFGASQKNSKLVDDFSLESLDPLRM